jgi:FkbM family methyltransferase
MTAAASHRARHSAASPTPVVGLGQRVVSARWPRHLEGVRAAGKKLAWTAFEARLVRTPVRYAFRELARPTLADYALRRGGGRFSVRHRSGDIDILRKFYAYRYYAWPAEVLDALRSLGRPVRILDLGANIGFFEVHAAGDLPIGHVVAFEPDPENANVLDRARAQNGADWEVHRACAANADGVAMFRSGHHNFSMIAEDGDRVVPTVDVFPYVAGADLIKMNVEGSEWEILQDPRLAATAGVWIVEYHRIRSPEEDITALVRRLFQRAGYTTRVAMEHEGNGLLWAWKTLH